MKTVNNVDQQIIVKRSFVVQQGECHREMKYQSQQCDFETTSRGSLTNHLKSVHLGIRYPCKQCDFQATQKANLKKHHQSVHTGIKHPCQECGLQFTYRSNLLQHQKSVHNNIKYPWYFWAQFWHGVWKFGRILVFQKKNCVSRRLG